MPDPCFREQRTCIAVRAPTLKINLAHGHPQSAAAKSTARDSLIRPSLTLGPLNLTGAPPLLRGTCAASRVSVLI